MTTIAPAPFVLTDLALDVLAARDEYTPTLESLAVGCPDRDEFEAYVETYAPKIIDGSWRYDDLLDHLEGIPWPVGDRDLVFSGPEEYGDPLYVRMLGIAKRVVRECRG